MPTALTIGPIHTLTQNTVYALPARRCQAYTSSSSGVEVNNTTSTTGFTSINVTDGGFVTGAAFIRITSGNSTLRLVAS